MRRSLGRCCTKTICLEHRYLPLWIRTLLYAPSRAIHRSDGVSTGESCLRHTRSYSGKHSKWSRDSRRDESDDPRLLHLYRIHVVRVCRRLLCRMSYLCLAREERMDERAQMTKLCEWSMWSEITKKISLLEGFSLSWIVLFSEIFLIRRSRSFGSDFELRAKQYSYFLAHLLPQRRSCMMPVFLRVGSQGNISSFHLFPSSFTSESTEVWEKFISIFGHAVVSITSLPLYQIASSL